MTFETEAARDAFERSSPDLETPMLEVSSSVLNASTLHRGLYLVRKSSIARSFCLGIWVKPARF